MNPHIHITMNKVSALAVIMSVLTILLTLCACTVQNSSEESKATTVQSSNEDSESTKEADALVTFATGVSGFNCEKISFFFRDLSYESPKSDEDIIDLFNEYIRLHYEKTSSNYAVFDVTVYDGHDVREIDFSKMNRIGNIVPSNDPMPCRFTSLNVPFDKINLEALRDLSNDPAIEQIVIWAVYYLPVDD